STSSLSTNKAHAITAQWLHPMGRQGAWLAPIPQHLTPIPTASTRKYASAQKESEGCLRMFPLPFYRMVRASFPWLFPAVALAVLALPNTRRQPGTAKLTAGALQVYALETATHAYSISERSAFTHNESSQASGGKTQTLLSEIASVDPKAAQESPART